MVQSGAGSVIHPVEQVIRRFVIFLLNRQDILMDHVCIVLTIQKLRCQKSQLSLQRVKLELPDTDNLYIHNIDYLSSRLQINMHQIDPTRN